MVTNPRTLHALSSEQKDFFEENGYLRVEGVFSSDEIARLSKGSHKHGPRRSTKGRGGDD